MASSSTYGEYREMSLTYACDENHPLSACYCYDLVNNAQHLRDIRSQYRVNFIGSEVYTSATGEGSNSDCLAYNGTNTTYQHCWTGIVPWNISHKGGPLTPVLRVIGRTLVAPNIFYVVAYMMPHNYAIGRNGYDESIYNTGAAWKWTGYTLSETTAPIIADEGANKTDDPIFASQVGMSLDQYLVWDIDADGNSNYFQTPIALYRLSLYCKSNGIIQGISLREYNE